MPFGTCVMSVEPLEHRRLSPPRLDKIAELGNSPAPENDKLAKWNKLAMADSARDGSGAQNVLGKAGMNSTEIAKAKLPQRAGLTKDGSD